jgi:hypothetical protein
MNIFTVNENGKIVPYQEQDFSKKKKEIDLEILLENNADQFFQNHKILIIGRQVPTNLSTFIDLLGVDESGASVVIELKRDKTPRETISQLLEYASYVDGLSYDNLSDIFKEYDGSGIELSDYHNEYFQSSKDISISWNKKIRLLIIAQSISIEIQQVATYLRKLELDIALMEFKYFVTKSGEEIISSDYILGEETLSHIKSSSSPLSRISKEDFFEELDSHGKTIFTQIADFIKNKQMLIRWGVKGFSANYQTGNSFVGIFFCYLKSSVFKQSIYTGFEEIKKKVNNPEIIIEYYKNEISKLGFFQRAASNYKCLINDKVTIEDIKTFLNIIENVINKIIENGMRTTT